MSNKITSIESFKALKALLMAEQEKTPPSFILAYEPKLKGHPFNLDGLGGNVAYDDQKYSPVLYVYDDEILEQIIALGIPINSARTAGLDAKGNPCTKVSINGAWYSKFSSAYPESASTALDETTQDVNHADGALITQPSEMIAPSKLELLDLDTDSTMQMAIAQDPDKDENTRLLLIRGIGSEDTKIRALLNDAGLLPKKKTAQNSGQSIPFKFETDYNENFYTVAIAVPAAVASAILAVPANRCENWTAPAEKDRLGVGDNVDIETWMDLAKDELTQLQEHVTNSGLPTKRVRHKAPLPTAETPIAEKPPLAEFKEQLQSAGLKQTAQLLASGETVPVLACANPMILNGLVANKTPIHTSQPLKISGLDVNGEAQEGLTYFKITPDSMDALNNLGIDIPSLPELPPRLPKEPFAAGRSGDFARSPYVALTNVVMHEETAPENGKKAYHVYMVCSGPRRLTDIKDNIGVPEGNFKWLTAKEQFPSILKLTVPEKTFRALENKRIGSVPIQSRETAFRKLDETVTKKSAAQLEAELIEKYKVQNKAAIKQIPDADKKIWLDDEKGEAALLKTLMTTDEGANQRPKYPMAFAKVNYGAQGNRTASRQLYISAEIKELEQLKGDIQTLNWLGKDQIRLLKSEKMLQLSLPDASWNHITAKLNTIDILKPQRDSDCADEEQTDTFKDREVALKNLKVFFDRRKEVGKYISDEQWAVRHLEAKELRLITVSSPNQSTLVALEKRKSTIQNAIKGLEESIAKLEAQKGASGVKQLQKGSPDYAALTADGVLETLNSSAISLRHEVKKQHRFVRDLEAKISALNVQLKATETASNHTELVVLDPDDHTEKLLGDAEKLYLANSLHKVQRDVAHGDKGMLRLRPTTKLLATLNEHGKGPRFMGAAPLGEVNEALVQEKIEYLKQAALNLAEIAPPTKAVAAPPPEKTTPRPPRALQRLMQNTTPILCYEEVTLADGTTSKQAVLVVPVETTALKDLGPLEERLRSEGWLEDSKLHPLDYNPHGKVGGSQTQATAAEIEPVKLDKDSLHRVKDIIADLQYHAPRCSSNDGQHSVDAIKGCLNDLEEIRNGGALTIDGKELITSSAMNNLIDSAGEFSSIRQSELQNAMNSFNNTLKPLLQSVAEEPAPARGSLNFADKARKAPRPSASQPAKTYDMVGFKLYLTDDAARTLEAHAQKMGIETRFNDKTIQPSALPAEIGQMLNPQTTRHSAGRG